MPVALTKHWQHAVPAGSTSPGSGSDVHLGAGVSLVLGILGCISLVAGTVPFFRAGYSKALTDALRGDRDDLQKRVEIVEYELAAEKRERVLAETKASVLEKVVTGRDQLERVLNLLEGRTPMFGEIQRELAGIAATLTHIQEAVDHD